MDSKSIEAGKFIHKKIVIINNVKFISYKRSHVPQIKCNSITNYHVSNNQLTSNDRYPSNMIIRDGNFSNFKY